MAKKKLEKIIDLEAMTLTITVLETGDNFVFPFNELPEEIKVRLAMHGLTQKMGDGLAGADLVDAKALLGKIWANLMDGKFAVVRAAADKLSKKDLLAGIEDLPEEEREVATRLLKKLMIQK